MLRIAAILLCRILLPAATDQGEGTAWDLLRWRTPGAAAADSMPIGNGRCAANVWATGDGAIHVLLAMDGAWGEQGQLLKLGALEVQLGTALQDGFRQELVLREGLIRIHGGGCAVEVRMDRLHDQLWIEVEHDQPRPLRAAWTTWRRHDRELPKDWWMSFFSNDIVLRSHADEVGALGDGIRGRHRNRSSIWRQSLADQGLAEAADRLGLVDPLLHRTFGGLLRVAEAVPAPEGLVAPARTRHRLGATLRCAIDADGDRWDRELSAEADRVWSADAPAASAAHRRAWDAFWQRSWIHVADPVSDRGYAWQRYLTACAGRGVHPIKFNGSLFTIDPGLPGSDPDWRRWGPPYWAQNTRCMYWPMLADGDDDLLDPFFAHYRSNQALAEERSRAYFGHEGACFPETMLFWGGYSLFDWGFVRDARPGTPGAFRLGERTVELGNPWIRWHWQNGLEAVRLGLDRLDYGTGMRFRDEVLLPLADGVLAFYANHYAGAPMRIAPAGALETWQDCRDPLPEIAGLTSVLDDLLALPGLDQARAERWRALRGRIPALPMDRDGSVLLPAAVMGQLANVENPELYAVFPYRLHGVGLPDLERARRTWNARRFRENKGWQQEPVHAALLGLADEAARLVRERYATPDPAFRFPGFHGPNYDWSPDQQHAANANLAMQAMLLQPRGRRLLLFPAWPLDQDVEFRLHAPGSTVITARLAGGRLTALTVDPPSRRPDIELPEPLR